MDDVVELYNGSVRVKYLPQARKNRYAVSIDGGDFATKQGVTEHLRIIDKPALRLWFMDEALRWIKDNCSWDQVDDDEVITDMGGGYYTVYDSHLKEAAVAYTKKSDKGKDVGSEVHGKVAEFLLAEMAR